MVISYKWSPQFFGYYSNLWLLATKLVIQLASKLLALLDLD